jgi:hypothetical protein
LFFEELKGQDDELGFSKRFGKLYALGKLTKAILAYCCLQFINRKRWQSQIKLHPIYVGNCPIGNVNVEQDPFGLLTSKYLLESGNRKPKSATWGGRAFDIKCKNFDSFSIPDEDHGNLKNGNVIDFLDNYDVGKSANLFNRRLSLEIFSLSHPVPLLSPLNEEVSTESNFENCFFDRRRRTKSGNFQSAKLISSSIFESTNHTEIPPKIPIPEHITQRKINAKKHVYLGSRYVKFAVGAYGSHFLNIMGISKKRQDVSETEDHHNHHSLATHANIPVEHIIFSSFLNTDVNNKPAVHPMVPVHYVVVDKVTKSVVVSLRGTLGLTDVITDIKANYVHYRYGEGMEGYAHSGMFYSAKTILQSEIRDSVCVSLNENPGFSLVLTGHSLGGGCAAILALLWSEKVVGLDGSFKFMTKHSSGLPKVDVHCYVYGCPAVLSGDLSKAAKDLITSFVFSNFLLLFIVGNDVVVRLSLGLVSDFRNVTINLATEKVYLLFCNL